MAEEEVVLEEAKDRMEKSLDSLQRDLAHIRTGRANPVLLEHVQVDYYGTATPLRQLATIHAPEARLLVVQPFDPGSLPQIEKAILKAELGGAPANDGKVLRVTLPELTQERRRELVKQVKKLGEDHKQGVRSSRRDAIALLKDLQKDGEIGTDDLHRGERKVQELTDSYSAKIDEAIAHKEEEILKV